VAAATGFKYVLKAAYWTNANVGSTHLFILRDGGASGDIKLRINVPVNTSRGELVLPGGGIAFNTDIHGAIASDINSLTLIYEQQAN
jgi:hypothetical protein